MKTIIDDSEMFEEFRLMKKACGDLQGLTVTEKIALRGMGVFVMEDQETRENVIV